MKINQYVPFKHKFDLQERMEKYQKQIQEQPDRIPIIVEPSEKSKLHGLPSPRFCLQKDKTLTYMKVSLSQKIAKMTKGSINAQKSGIFFYIGNNILGEGNQTVQQIYQSSKDIDGFLYVSYSEMQVFGCQTFALQLGENIKRDKRDKSIY